jgi:hypothetical protein
VKDLFVHKGMVKALYRKQPERLVGARSEAVATIRIFLDDDVMYHVMDEESLVAI